jgi:four helix bundle protein
MSEHMRNPKAEIRRPKEGRRPKSEVELDSPDSSFWEWGTERCCDTLLLHDGPPGKERSAPPLDERTAQFGEAVIAFARKIPATPLNERLISQLVGAATSIGANYCEADDSISGKEFKQKIGTCRKESKETMFFLRMIANSEPALASEARPLWREAKELNLIFGAIWRK